AFRESYRAGRIRYLTIPYTVIADYYRTGPAFDLCIVQVAPPDAEGRMSFGTAADFSPIAAANSRRVLAHVHPAMPATRGPSLHLVEVDYLHTAESPLLQMADAPASKTLAAIAGHIAAAVPDGATLQFC